MTLKLTLYRWLVGLNLLSSLWIANRSLAQSAKLSIGPAIGVSQYTVSLAQDAPVSFGIRALPGVSLGIDLAYTKKRILVGSQALFSSFNYQVTNTLQLTLNQSVPYRVKTKVSCYTLPISLAYRLVSTPQLSLYGGGGLDPEWKGAFQSMSMDDQSGSSIQLPPKPAFRSFTVGGHIQAVIRVPITSQWTLQASSALLYNPQLDIVFGQRNNLAYRAQVTFNVLLN